MCTLALLGTAISVGGTLMQGVQQQQMANYQAKAYEQQAQADAQSAAFERSQERHKQDLLEAQARAQAGASGVGIAGSPTEVLAANARQGQVDLDAMLYGSRLRQNNLNTQAAVSRLQGKQAMTASIFNAGSSLIGGLSKIYDPTKSPSSGSLQSGNAVIVGASPFSRASWAGNS
ncbi:MAG: hypothetical protein EOQ94_20900 [Mesorhizobium sp.]|uniref:hypothetical protein n=1 Tax=Mesorhizobium sp. TaxID=1871066 RepID=UPI000FE6915E|nr:hypothetical protein [Mesorhizobium sp.]RWI19454.1 MAG: hypothetical protein EOQ94_20900 [Mesorhizobium sp.]